MEVIHETSTIQQPRPLPTIPSGVQMVSEMEKKFKELEEAKAKIVQEAANPVPQVDQNQWITKRNSANILVIELGRKKQLMIVSGVSGLLMVVGSGIAGVMGAFIPFALFTIFVAWNFINNEREIKEYKKAWSL